MEENLSVTEYKNKLKVEVSKLDEEIKRLSEERKLLDEEKKKVEKREKYLKKLEKDVPYDKLFRLSDGKILRNLQDLKEALQEMDDKTFYEHVNSEKNDFANWVRDLIDIDLGDQMSSIKKRENLIHFLFNLNKSNIDEMLKKLKEEEKDLSGAKEKILEAELQLRNDEYDLMN